MDSGKTILHSLVKSAIEISIAPEAERAKELSLY